jgi:hypothetical protein
MFDSVSASYPDRSRRTALAPGILAAITLLVGVAIITSDGFIVIRYVVSILALICAVFAWQARQWWWIVGLAPIAVLWNPVFPITIGQADLWLGLQYLAAGLFIAVGILVKVPETPRRR